jgi:membrane protease YdiL (CAAX protease family)
MFQNSSYFSQFVITLTIAFLMNIIASFFAAVIAIPLYHLNETDLTNLMSSLDDPRSIVVLKFFQIIMSLSGFVITALLLAYLFSPSSNTYLHLEKKPGIKFLVGAFLLVLVVFPSINFLGALNSGIHFPDFLGGLNKYIIDKSQENEKIMEHFLSDTYIRGLFVNIVMIAVIPAIGEELFFRGVIQNIFSRMTKNYHWGVWISAALFSLLHSNIFSFLPIFLLGAIFGYMLVWSGSIWVPILAHFVNNLSAVVMYYLVNTGRLNRDVLEYGASREVLPIVLVSAILTAVLLWLFYKNAEKNEGNIEPIIPEES